MGISKDIYGQKLEKIYTTIKNETKSHQNPGDLENEFVLLSHLCGFANYPVLNGLKFSFRFDGVPYNKEVSTNFFNLLITAIKRLITKGYVGTLTESKVKAEYEEKVKGLNRLLESQKKETEKYRNLCTTQTATTVPKTEYASLQKENQANANEVDRLRVENEILSARVKELEESLNTSPTFTIQYEPLSVAVPPTSVVVNGKEIPLNEGISEEVDKTDYKGKYESLQEEVQKLSKAYNHNHDVCEQQQKVINGLKSDKEKLLVEKKDLRSQVTKYISLEKKLLPELRKSLYQKRRQGKSLSLSKKDIELVVKGYLYGKSRYSISKDYNIDYSTVQSILNCQFTGVNSLKKVLGVLHKVNGHWTEDRKDLLEMLITQYETEIRTCEALDTQLKGQIDMKIQSFSDYLQALKGSYIDYEYEGDKKPKVKAMQFQLGEKPRYVEADIVDEIFKDS